LTSLIHAKHEIEAIHLPNHEVFRELAAHLQNWASQHQEFLQLLDTGHSNLQASWEGDGSHAYTLLHTHTQEVGNTHLDQFQHAHETLIKTSNLVEEAEHKKSHALRDIGIAIGATAAAAVFTAGIAVAAGVTTVSALVAGVITAAGAAASFFLNAFVWLGGLIIGEQAAIVLGAGVITVAAVVVAVVTNILKKIPVAAPVNIPSLTIPSGVKFTPTALQHIFFGDKKKGKFNGYHYAAANALTNAGSKIVKVIQKFPDGVFSAQVEGPGGTAKSGNGGVSTFFPVDMSPQDVVNAITTAYNNRQFVSGTKNTYEYVFPAGGPHAGMEINMYINGAGQIISAFPTK
jgi:uncharacterized protein YukE